MMKIFGFNHTHRGVVETALKERYDGVVSV